jgi:hypothetical protein
MKRGFKEDEERMKTAYANTSTEKMNRSLKQNKVDTTNVSDRMAKGRDF